MNWNRFLSWVLFFVLVCFVPANSVQLIKSLSSACNTCKKIIPKQHQCPSCLLTSKNWTASANDLSAVSTLYNTSILFIGDSLSWQSAHATNCYLEPAANIKIKFQRMYTFPIYMEELEQMVQAQLHYTAIVFTIGTWYNWNWTQTQAEEEDFDNRNTINVSLTQNILENHCKPDMPMKLKNAKDVFYRSKIEQQCNGLTGRQSYKSGILRLVSLIKSLKGKGPMIFWKDVPPQHYDYNPSGQYTTGKQASKCAPIEDAQAGYSRNRAADAALEDSGIQIIKTWKYDFDQWKYHADPCTHYCSPSPATFNWAAQTLATIAAAITAKNGTVLKKTGETEMNKFHSLIAENISKQIK
jgi:hypothetical protein